MHRLQPLRRAHEHARVAHEQVAALDDFDAHLPRQIGVLEIRAVVGAGREQHHGRVGHARRRDVPETFQKLLRIILHRPHADALEHRRKRALHRPAVFQHVADARRAAPVVLQHEVIAVLVADQIRAADVDINSLGHLEVDEFAPEMPGRQNIKFRDDAVLQNFLLVINVVQEQVQRRDALRQAAFQEFPFRRRNDARQQVERENFLRPLCVAIDVERDALAQKCRVHRLPLGVEFRRLHPLEQFVEFPVMRPHAAARVEHFVKTAVDFIFSEHVTKLFFERRAQFPPARPRKNIPRPTGPRLVPGPASPGFSML